MGEAVYINGITEECRELLSFVQAAGLLKHCLLVSSRVSEKRRDIAGAWATPAAELLYRGLVRVFPRICGWYPSGLDCAVFITQTYNAIIQKLPMAT